MPQILIVEDDPAIANTLAYVLRREGWQCTWVTTLTEALATLPTLPKVSAIILDVGLPDGTGWQLCQSIRHGQHHAHAPIVFLTAKDDAVDKIVGLEMGADDYITKPFSPREVVARIKAIWRRESLAQQLSGARNAELADTSFERHSQTGHWHYDARQYCLSFNDIPLTLSKTELALMLTFLAHPQQVMSREQLLSAVSLHPEHRLARTIDAHIKTLRQKLAQISDSDVIITHRGIGYALA